MPILSKFATPLTQRPPQQSQPQTVPLRSSARLAQRQPSPTGRSPRPISTSAAVTSLPNPEIGSVVRQLPTQRSLPLWLRWLMRAQRSSLVVAFGLMVAALGVYSSAVYTQQMWGQEHGKLKKMQRDERQMVAAGEGLKTQLAEQAVRPEAGLVPKTLNNMVVVPVAVPRPPRPLSIKMPPPLPERPVGY